MDQRPVEPTDVSESETSKSAELQTFLFLTVVLAPVAAVVCVGGYGFIVWMSQLVLGPPGS